jgi:hypothetical protein
MVVHYQRNVASRLIWQRISRNVTYDADGMCTGGKEEGGGSYRDAMGEAMVPTSRRGRQLLFLYRCVRHKPSTDSI